MYGALKFIVSTLFFSKATFAISKAESGLTIKKNPFKKNNVSTMNIKTNKEKLLLPSNKNNQRCL